ncbi:hypothetical protein FHX85_005137 [Clostridium beijerinckii]|nr:hypothetical protein [Clostridium beijerinckii]
MKILILSFQIYIAKQLRPEIMHIARRNKDYAVVPVSKEIMMDDSKITSCIQDASLKGAL